MDSKRSANMRSISTKLHDYFKRPRQLLQSSVLVMTLCIGFQFYLYVHQAMVQESITVQRPPGVEGFLPIGALMGWKYFFLSGQWDDVHPAAMVIFGWAVLVSLFFRKSFCGWFCPIGTLSEWFWRIGNNLFGRNYKLPMLIDMSLRSLKYLLLGFFLWAVYAMDVGQISAFMNSPYYKISDAKMLFFFTRLSVLAAGVLLSLTLLSFLVKNFWCRYLCPYGALLGLFAIVGPTRIHRSEKFCIECRACDRVCPSNLLVSIKSAVNSPECSGCMSCVAACPKKGALTMDSVGLNHRFWTPIKAGTFIVLFFALTVCTAAISGYWRGSVSDHEFRVILEAIDAPENSHPSIGSWQ